MRTLNADLGSSFDTWCLQGNLRQINLPSLGPESWFVIVDDNVRFIWKLNTAVDVKESACGWWRVNTNEHFSTWLDIFPYRNTKTYFISDIFLRDTGRGGGEDNGNGERNCERILEREGLVFKVVWFYLCSLLWWWWSAWGFWGKEIEK